MWRQDLQGELGFVGSGIIEAPALAERCLQYVARFLEPLLRCQGTSELVTG